MTVPYVLTIMIRFTQSLGLISPQMNRVNAVNTKTAAKDLYLYPYDGLIPTFQRRKTLHGF